MMHIKFNAELSESPRKHLFVSPNTTRSSADAFVKEGPFSGTKRTFESAALWQLRAKSRPSKSGGLGSKCEECSQRSYRPFFLYDISILNEALQLAKSQHHPRCRALVRRW